MQEFRFSVKTGVIKLLQKQVVSMPWEKQKTHKITIELAGAQGERTVATLLERVYTNGKRSIELVGLQYGSTNTISPTFMYSVSATNGSVDQNPLMQRVNIEGAEYALKYKPSKQQTTVVYTNNLSDIATKSTVDGLSSLMFTTNRGAFTYSLVSL